MHRPLDVGARSLWPRSLLIVAFATLGVCFLLLARRREVVTPAVYSLNRSAGFRITSGTDEIYQRLPSDYRPQEDEPGCRLVLMSDVVGLPVLPPPRQLPLCTVLSVEMMNEPQLLPYYDALGEGYRRTALHRKAWEWAMGLHVLHSMNAVTPDAVGLSLAAGHEPVHYYLSNFIGMMTAGDMYGEGGFAQDGTARTEILEHPERFAPPGVAWRPDHLRLVYQDARNLSAFGDASVDFVVSFSSIEHFGTPGDVMEGAARSIQEQARVVKPGGLVFLTTELLVTGLDDDLGNGWNMGQLHRAILQPAAAAGLQLLQPINWAVSNTSLITPVDVGPVDTKYKCDGHTPHAVICYKPIRHALLPYICKTSIALAWRRT